MNYMQAVELTEINPNSIKARVFYQKREVFFTFPFDRIQIVPAYVIHEAIFQTAGRLVRVKSENKKAGIVASFRDFKFLRPLLPNEMITIEAHVVSIKEECIFFRIKVLVEEEIIIEKGSLILLMTDSILSPHLNNQMPQENEEMIQFFKQWTLDAAAN